MKLKALRNEPPAHEQGAEDQGEETAQDEARYEDGAVSVQQAEHYREGEGEEEVARGAQGGVLGRAEEGGGEDEQEGVEGEVRREVAPAREQYHQGEEEEEQVVEVGGTGKVVRHVRQGRVGPQARVEEAAGPLDRAAPGLDDGGNGSGGLPAPLLLVGVEEQRVAEAQPQVGGVGEETRGGESQVEAPPAVDFPVPEPLEGDGDEQEDADVARRHGDAGERARQQQVPPYPRRPQGAGRERQEEALRVGRVQEKRRWEEGQGEDRAARDACVPVLLGYAVDKEEGEG